MSSLETRFAQEESRQALEEASIVARIQAELASASERRRDNLQETLRSVRGQAGETAQVRATESDTRQRAFAQLGGNNEAVRTTLERTLDECTLFKQGGLEVSARTAALPIRTDPSFFPALFSCFNSSATRHFSRYRQTTRDYAIGFFEASTSQRGSLVVDRSFIRCGIQHNT